MGRSDLRLHDPAALRLHRADHARAAATIRYQHATADRDRPIAAALGGLGRAVVAPINARQRRASRP